MVEATFGRSVGLLPGASGGDMMVGTQVRLSGPARARGVVQDALRGELRPDFAGTIVEVRGHRALCSHAMETCGCFLSRLRSECHRCAGLGSATRRYLDLRYLEVDRRPKITSVVLRRAVPRVTFGTCRACYLALVAGWERRELEVIHFYPRREVLRAAWPAAIASWAGGWDEIVAIVSGREQLIERLSCDRADRRLRSGRLGLAIDELLDEADYRDYWHAPQPLELSLTHPIPKEIGGERWARVVAARTRSSVWRSFRKGLRVLFERIGARYIRLDDHRQLLAPGHSVCVGGKVRPAQLTELMEAVWIRKNGDSLVVEMRRVALNDQGHPVLAPGSHTSVQTRPQRSRRYSLVCRKRFDSPVHDESREVNKARVIAGETNAGFQGAYS